MRPRATLATLVAVACCSTTACGGRSHHTSPPHGAPSSFPASPGDRGITSCREVTAPKGGFGEGDYGVDAANGIVSIHVGDWRRGRYRNVSYDIAYLTDPSCRTNPEVAGLLDRLQPPGWRRVG